MSSHGLFLLAVFFDFFFTHSCYFTCLVVVLLYTGHCGWDIVETGFCYLPLKCVDICSSRQLIVEAWFYTYLGPWEAQGGLPSLSSLTEFRHQTLSPLWCVAVQISVQFFQTFNFCFLLCSLDSPLHMWSSGVRQGFEGIYMQIWGILAVVALFFMWSTLSVSRYSGSSEHHPLIPQANKIKNFYWIIVNLSHINSGGGVLLGKNHIM